AGGRVDPGQQPGDGALAAAALARQGHDLPFPDGQADLVHGVQGLAGQRVADLEVLAQPVGPQQRRGRVGGDRAGAGGGLLGHGSLLTSSAAGAAAPSATALLRPSSCSRQRTSRPSTWYRSGGVVLHRSMTWGQRGANRQLSYSRLRSGGLPGMPVSLTLGPRMDGNASSSPAL